MVFESERDAFPELQRKYESGELPKFRGYSQQVSLPDGDDVSRVRIRGATKLRVLVLIKDQD
jgi:hypothetical protein